MMHFADRLTQLVEERGPICAGLDPRKDQLPKCTTEIAWARTVIRLLRDRIPIFKPQIAFWNDDWGYVAKMLDLPGGTADAMVLVDCKRGDIGSTASAYAKQIFERTWVDAITLNPYLGRDALHPFIDHSTQDRGLFILVKTSNPGSADLQDIELSGSQSVETVCEKVAEMVHELGENHLGVCGRSRVGAVIGLTTPLPLICKLRDLMPNAFFLMPGYGAQGGDPRAREDAKDARGGGVLISASRSLTLPWWGGPAPEKWQRRIEIELKIMQKDLGVLHSASPNPETV